MSSRVIRQALVLAAAVGSALSASAPPAQAQQVTAPVEWTNVVNATASGSKIQKSGGCSGCADAGGTSRQAIATGDGYAEFTPTLGARLYAGLSSTATRSTDPGAIDFAFSFWPDGGWDIRERNAYRAEGRFAAGDVFRVALAAGRIKYFKNGSLVYSSTAPVTLPLVLDTTLVGTSASIGSATISAAGPTVQPCAVPVTQAVRQPIEWTNLANATATGAAIRKSGGCVGCTDAGGTSVQTITAGDGSAEFTPVFGARLYAGLSSTRTTNTDPAAIDFAFSFWPDGGWDVRERNSYRAEGRFAAGDVFGVALSGGRIKYYKNGVLVYASTASVTLPLVFDTTLIGAGASIATASLSAATSQPTNPVTIVTTAVPGTALRQTYSTTLQASGGCGTYGWSLAAGSLPAGLNLSTAGVIGGAPAAVGTFAFTVRASDASSPSNYDDQPLTISVADLTQPVVVTTTKLPATRVGESYGAVLAASGGSGAFIWTIAAGSLPSGLSLDTGGTIRGHTAAGGRYTFTVRATDVANAANAADRVLTMSVLAAAPPDFYQAIADRTTRQKGPLPALGPAGYTFTDPVFGTRLARLTDAATRPLTPGFSYRTPSGTHTNAWSADAGYFYVTSTDGTPVPFAFDAATMRATRLPAGGGDSLTLRFANEPTFSYIRPGVLYGTYSGGDLRSVDEFDIESRTYTPLIDLDTLAPNLAGTYTGGLGNSAGPVERLIAFFGGTGQDRHFYLVVFDRANPANRRLLDTAASTIDGVATNITLNFKIHAAAIDRSGRYVTVYPTGQDLQAPRSAAPAYIWDTLTNTITATPLVATRSGGHDAYGYGYRVNQDCCTSSPWDAAQWQLRSLATPTATTDLIAPVLLPKEIYLSGHPSWHHAQPVAMVPFLDATYRFGLNTAPWRAWDDEIIAVQTEAAGTGGTVWRFAHHRSAVAHDTDPSRFSFWYTPRANVSPDGLWVLFTSNWEKTLGTDPRGDVGGTYRQDVFIAALKSMP